jgi:hypothetical protein
VIVVAIPGASLLKFVATDAGLIVTCPGCEATQILRGTPGTTTIDALSHDAQCPVYRRIRRATGLPLRDESGWITPNDTEL